MKEAVLVVVCAHVLACASSLPPQPPVQAPVSNLAEPEPAELCRTATQWERRQIWSATTDALRLCAHYSRRGIFIRGEYNMQMRADSRGQISVRTLGPTAPAAFRSCLDESLHAQHPGPFEECVETTLHYRFDSAVDLTNHATFIGSGEQGEWVFRTPPSETPSFDIVQTQGFATRSDARSLGAWVFADGLETCFADAVYSALANEAPFELDVPLEIRYEPQGRRNPQVQILSSPSPILAACAQDLDWPAANVPDFQQGVIRLRVEPRSVLELELIVALAR